MELTEISLFSSFCHSTPLNSVIDERKLAIY